MQEDRRGDGVVWALGRCLKDCSGGGEGRQSEVCMPGERCLCVIVDTSARV